MAQPSSFVTFEKNWSLRFRSTGKLFSTRKAKKAYTGLVTEFSAINDVNGLQQFLTKYPKTAKLIPAVTLSEKLQNLHNPQIVVAVLKQENLAKELIRANNDLFTVFFERTTDKEKFVKKYWKCLPTESRSQYLLTAARYLQKHQSAQLAKFLKVKIGRLGFRKTVATRIQKDLDIKDVAKSLNELDNVKAELRTLKEADPIGTFETSLPSLPLDQLLQRAQKYEMVRSYLIRHPEFLIKTPQDHQASLEAIRSITINEIAKCAQRYFLAQQKQDEQ